MLSKLTNAVTKLGLHDAKKKRKRTLKPGKRITHEKSTNTQEITLFPKDGNIKTGTLHKENLKEMV